MSTFPFSINHDHLSWTREDQPDKGNAMIEVPASLFAELARRRWYLAIGRLHYSFSD